MLSMHTFVWRLYQGMGAIFHEWRNFINFGFSMTHSFWHPIHFLGANFHKARNFDAFNEFQDNSTSAPHSTSWALFWLRQGIWSLMAFPWVPHPSALSPAWAPNSLCHGFWHNFIFQTWSTSDAFKFRMPFMNERELSRLRWFSNFPLQEWIPTLS